MFALMLKGYPYSGTIPKREGGAVLMGEFSLTIFRHDGTYLDISMCCGITDKASEMPNARS